MSKFLKDKKITIYSHSEQTDDEGFSSETLTAVHSNIWAYARQTSQDEWFSSQAEQIREDMLFIINWHAEINSSMMILYRDKWYDIVRVDTFEGNKTDIKIYASETASGAIPDNAEIKQYTQNSI